MKPTRYASAVLRILIKPHRNSSTIHAETRPWNEECEEIMGLLACCTEQARILDFFCILSFFALPVLSSFARSARAPRPHSTTLYSVRHRQRTAPTSQSCSADPCTSAAMPRTPWASAADAARTRSHWRWPGARAAETPPLGGRRPGSDAPTGRTAAQKGSPPRSHSRQRPPPQAAAWRWSSLETRAPSRWPGARGPPVAM